MTFSTSFQRLCGVIFCIFFAVILYGYTFGIDFLNPLFVNWVYTGDVSITFFGFNFFNQEPWHLPLGKILTYSYPESTSVVFTDSIPLVAVLMKALGIKTVYQFQGIWVLFCFVLQVTASFLILWKHTQKWLLSLLGSVLFLTFPSFLSRCFGITRHFSLLPHFVILGALALLFGSFQQADTKGLKLTLHDTCWLVLMLLGLGFNFYLFILVGVLYFAKEFPILEGLRFKQHYFTFLAGILGFAFLMGYFAIPLENSSAGGFGVYSMNLNAFFNPFAFSRFLPELATTSSQQFEGYNYLGLGLILLFAFGLRKSLWQEMTPALRISFVFLALLTLSFRLTFFHLLLPEWGTIPLYGALFFFLIPRSYSTWKRVGASIALLLLLFGVGKLARASGRMFWPVEYFVILMILFKRPNLGLIAAVVLLQVIDLSPEWTAIRELNLKSAQQFAPENPFPESLKPELFDHIALQDAGSIPTPSLTRYVLRYQKTIGPLFTNRASGKFRRNEQIQLEDEIRTLQLRPRILYLVGNEGLWITTMEKCKATPAMCSHFISGVSQGYRYLLKQ